MFASKGLTEHAARGIIGLALLVVTSYLAPHRPLVAAATGLFAMATLRGCPTCWLIGLYQTAKARLTGAPNPQACLNGSCMLISEQVRRTNPKE